MRRIIRKGDAGLNPIDLSFGTKMVLLPAFIKAFGVAKAMLFLFGK